VVYTVVETVVETVIETVVKTVVENRQEEKEFKYIFFARLHRTRTQGQEGERHHEKTNDHSPPAESPRRLSIETNGTTQRALLRVFRRFCGKQANAECHHGETHPTWT